MPTSESTLPSQLEALLGAVYAAPEDWDLRLITADCAEESGMQDLADCLRWQAREHKRPRASVLDVGKHIWYDAESMYSIRDADPLPDLPRVVFQALEHVHLILNTVSEYPSGRDAEQALQVAWVRARKGGWMP